MDRNQQIQQAAEKLQNARLNIDQETVRQLHQACGKMSASCEQLSKAFQSVYDRLGQPNTKVVVNKRPYWRQFDNSK